MPFPACKAVVSRRAPHRLLDPVRERVRYLHDSPRTERADVHEVRPFVRFHGLRRPREMGQAGVEAFLRWPSVERGVSGSTHRQTLSALLFLYRQVLSVQAPWLQAIGHPPRKPRLPVVRSAQEAAAVPSAVPAGPYRLLARLRHGSGMRLCETPQLRVKDVGLDRRTRVACDGKGGEYRLVMPPAARLVERAARLDSARACGLRTVREWPSRADVAATMVDTQVLKFGAGAVRSPLDAPGLQPVAAMSAPPAPSMAVAA